MVWLLLLVIVLAMIFINTVGKTNEKAKQVGKFVLIGTFVLFVVYMIFAIILSNQERTKESLESQLRTSTTESN